MIVSNFTYVASGDLVGSMHVLLEEYEPSDGQETYRIGKLAQEIIRRKKSCSVPSGAIDPTFDLIIRECDGQRSGAFLP